MSGLSLALWTLGFMLIGFGLGAGWAAHNIAKSLKDKP